MGRPGAGDRRSDIAQAGLGLLALATLAAATLGVSPWSDAGRPAVIVAAQEYRVSALSPGRYAWTLEDGSRAGGPGLLNQSLYQFERNDLVALSLEPSLRSGARVEAGQFLGTLRSSHIEGELASLRAQRASLAARQALLEAGARPEAVQRARQAVSVAEARDAGLRSELERSRRLVADGAAGAAELDVLTHQVEVSSREVALARADLALASVGARPEEVGALVEEARAIDARVAELEAMNDSVRLLSPITGVLELGASAEADGEPVVLRVRAVDTLFARFPVPAGTALRTGDAVSFQTRALPGRDFQAQVTEVSSAARPLAGEPVQWATAEIHGVDGALSPGWVGTVGLPGAGAGGLLAWIGLP